MAKFVTFLPCILLVAPLILQECAANLTLEEAENIVLKSYDNDPCSKLKPSSGYQARDAAETACMESMKALKRVQADFQFATVSCGKVAGSEKEQCLCGNCGTPDHIEYLTTFRKSALKFVGQKRGTTEDATSSGAGLRAPTKAEAFAILGHEYKTVNPPKLHSRKVTGKSKHHRV